MAGKMKVPDAWEDDDWETQADRVAAEPATPEPAPAPRTKKERLAQHAELNRKIWEAAQEPDNGAPLQYLASAPAPPLAQPIKAPMTVLARKPMVAKRDPVTGVASLTLQDSDDEKDSKTQETPEQIRARQQREREEKQRRYDEARAKIFGESAAGGGSGSATAKGLSGRNSGASTPGTVTPPRSAGERRGRGRGRGNFRGNNDRGSPADFSRSRENLSSGGASLREEPRQGELFDPNYCPKPGFTLERKGDATSSGRATPRDDEQVIRTPRGPDGSGRGGFGFARRGTRDT